MLTLDILAEGAGLGHGFFTRAGGVSEGIYASLNCGPGSGDRAERVAENRRRAMAQLGLSAAALRTCRQVHGSAVRTVTETDSPGRVGEADGLVTDRPGIALGILTADCAPVLLHDPAAGVIGAAHAGWRGALIGILDETVAAMERLGAARAGIRAAIGPCIGRESYEVGPEFPAPFLAEDAASARFFRPAARDSHHLFDLAGFVAARLARIGVAACQAVAADTCAEPDCWFSYRRACQEGAPDYGRLLSAIALVR